MVITAICGCHKNKSTIFLLTFIQNMNTEPEELSDGYPLEHILNSKIIY